MTQSIYLAARYSRRSEVKAYAIQLHELGYAITSRWLDGVSILTSDGLSEEAPYPDRVRLAEQDWQDLLVADTCISFTEPPRASHTRGGRHVELGGAIALGKRVIVVGHRENVFHCLPAIEFYSNWQDCFQMLSCRVSAIHAKQHDLPTPRGPKNVFWTQK